MGFDADCADGRGFYGFGRDAKLGVPTGMMLHERIRAATVFAVAGQSSISKRFGMIFTKNPAKTQGVEWGIFYGVVHRATNMSSLAGLGGIFLFLFICQHFVPPEE